VAIAAPLGTKTLEGPPIQDISMGEPLTITNRIVTKITWCGKLLTLTVVMDIFKVLMGKDTGILNGHRPRA